MLGNVRQLLMAGVLAWAAVAWTSRAALQERQSAALQFGDDDIPVLVLLEEDMHALDTSMHAYHASLGAIKTPDKVAVVQPLTDKHVSEPLLSHTYAPEMRDLFERIKEASASIKDGVALTGELEADAEDDGIPAAAAGTGRRQESISTQHDERQKLKTMRNLVVGLLHANTSSWASNEAVASAADGTPVNGAQIAREATVAGRVRWLEHEVNTGGAMVAGSADGKLVLGGPAADGAELVVERLPHMQKASDAQERNLLQAVEAEVTARRALATNGSRTEFLSAQPELLAAGVRDLARDRALVDLEGAEGVWGLVWMPESQPASRFAVGSTVSLLGFRLAANRGAFRVAGYAPGGNGLVLGEIGPSSTGDGRAGWASAEVNEGGAMLERIGRRREEAGTPPDAQGFSSAAVVMGPARAGAAVRILAGEEAERQTNALLGTDANTAGPVLVVRGPRSMLGTNTLEAGDAVRLRGFRWAGNRGVFLVAAVINGTGAQAHAEGQTAEALSAEVLPKQTDVSIVLREAAPCRGGLVDWVVPEFATSGGSLLVDPTPGQVTALHPLQMTARALVGPASAVAPVLIMGSYPAAAVAAAAARAASKDHDAVTVSFLQERSTVESGELTRADVDGSAVIRNAEAVDIERFRSRPLPLARGSASATQQIGEDDGVKRSLVLPLKPERPASAAVDLMSHGEPGSSFDSANPQVRSGAAGLPGLRKTASARTSAAGKWLSSHWEWSPQLGVGRVALVWAPSDAVRLGLTGASLTGVGWPVTGSTTSTAQPLQPRPLRGAVVRLEGFSQPGNDGSFALVGRVGEVFVLAELPPGAAALAASLSDNSTCLAAGVGDVVDAQSAAAWTGAVTFAQTLPWLSSPRAMTADMLQDAVQSDSELDPGRVVAIPAIGRDAGGEMVVVQGGGLRAALIRAARASRTIALTLVRAAAASSALVPGSDLPADAIVRDAAKQLGPQWPTDDGNVTDRFFALYGLRRVSVEVTINGRACRRSSPLSARAVLCVTPRGLGAGLDVGVAITPVLSEAGQGEFSSIPATATRAAAPLLDAASGMVTALDAFSYYEGADEQSSGVPRALADGTMTNNADLASPSAVRQLILAGSRPLPAEIARAERSMALERFAGCAFNCTGHGECEQTSSLANTTDADLEGVANTACRCQAGWAGAYCHIPFLACPGGSGEPLLEADGQAVASECSGNGNCDSIRGQCSCKSDLVDIGAGPALSDPVEAEERSTRLAARGIVVADRVPTWLAAGRSAPASQEEANSAKRLSVPRRFLLAKWGGRACDRRQCPSINDADCSGNGECDDSSGTCTCNTDHLRAADGSVLRLPWYGAACDRRRCPRDASGVICSGRGRCTEGEDRGGGGDGQCACAPGFKGAACSVVDLNPGQSRAGGRGPYTDGGDGGNGNAGDAPLADADSWSEWEESPLTDGKTPLAQQAAQAASAVHLGRLGKLVGGSDEGQDLHPTSLERAAFMIYASALSRGSRGDRAISRAALEEVFEAGGSTSRAKAIKRASRVLDVADADRDGWIQADEFVAASRISRLNLGLVAAAFAWPVGVTDADSDLTVSVAELAKRQLWQAGMLGREASEAAAVAGPAVLEIFTSGDFTTAPPSRTLATSNDLRSELAPGEAVLPVLAGPFVVGDIVGRSILLDSAYSGPKGRGFQVLKLAARPELPQKLAGYAKAGGGRADVLWVNRSVCSGLVAGDSIVVRSGMVLRLDGSEDRSAPKKMVLTRPATATILSCDPTDGKMTLAQPIKGLQRPMQMPASLEGSTTGDARTGKQAGRDPYANDTASSRPEDAMGDDARGPSPSPSPSPGTTYVPNPDQAVLTATTKTAKGEAEFAAVEIVGLVVERLPRSHFAGAVQHAGIVVDAEPGALGLPASDDLAFHVRKGDAILLVDPLGAAIVESVSASQVVLHRAIGVEAVGGGVDAGRLLKLNNSLTTLRPLIGSAGSLPAAPVAALAEKGMCTQRQSLARGQPPAGPLLPGDIVSLGGQSLSVRRCGSPGSGSMLFLGMSFDGPTRVVGPLYRRTPLAANILPLPATVDALSALTHTIGVDSIAVAASHDLRGLVAPGHLVMVGNDPPRPVTGVFHWGLSLAKGTWERQLLPPLLSVDAEGDTERSALQLLLVLPVHATPESVRGQARAAEEALIRLGELYSTKGIAVPHPPTTDEMAELGQVSSRSIAGGTFSDNSYLVSVVKRAQMTHRHLDRRKDGPVTSFEYRTTITADASHGRSTIAAPVPYAHLASFAADPKNKEWCKMYPDGEGPGPKLCKRTRRKPHIEKELKLQDNTDLAGKISSDLTAAASGGGGGGTVDEEEQDRMRMMAARRKRDSLEALGVAQNEVSRAVGDARSNDGGGGGGSSSSSSSSSSGGGGGGGGGNGSPEDDLPDEPEPDEPPDLFPAFFWFPSPFFWCPMDMPFGMVFCPTPIPQLNILIKMMIPGVIRPAIGTILAEFAAAQETMLKFIEGILPAVDGTGPRGGPPGFLQLAAAPATGYNTPHNRTTAESMQQLLQALAGAMNGEKGMTALQTLFRNNSHSPLSHEQMRGMRKMISAASRELLTRRRAGKRTVAQVLGNSTTVLAHIPPRIQNHARRSNKRRSSRQHMDKLQRQQQPSLLQSSARAGKHKGTLTPALKKQMTDAMVPLMLPDVLKPIVEIAHARIHDALIFELTASLRPLLHKTLAVSLQNAISRGVAAAIDAELRGAMLHSLRPTAEAILLSLTRSVSPALARSIVHGTLHTVYSAADPAMAEACAACEHTGVYCGKCTKLTAKLRAGLRAADTAVGRLGDHYAKHYATHSLEMFHPDGFKKMVEEDNMAWPPLGQTGSKTNPDGVKL